VVWVHDNTFSYTGRNGITINAGSYVTVERNSFDKVGLYVFDIEPDFAYQVDTFDTFRNNTVGTYSLSDKYTGYFFAANGAAGSTVHDVTVTGNTVTGGSLLTIVHLARRQNVVFTTNTSTVRATGPVLRFAHVDGLTVTGNVQPLTSGDLASITDSTGVTYP
jgi:Right handed beta helix region